MTHEELHELTGGYVLGALSEAEHRDFEAHLATCAVCAQEVKALREVATALAHAAPQTEVSPGLRDRVLRAAVASEADASDTRVVAFTPVVRPPSARALPPWLRGWPWPRRLRRSPWDSTR